MFQPNQPTIKNKVLTWSRDLTDFVYSVPGFGAFIKKEDVAEFVEKADDFNARLRELRNSVMNLLEKRYAGRSGTDNVFYHKFILRFNPRIRYGIFLLSREYASNKYFIRVCANSAYKGESRYNKENIAPWVTCADSKMFVVQERN